MRNLLGALAVAFFLSACGSSSSDVHYVALGASDATGIGAVPITDGYVYQIQDGVRNCGESINLTNLGIPGATIKTVETKELPVADPQDPNLVTLWPGPNDIIRGTSPSDFESSLNKILSELNLNANTFTVLANVPDLTQLPAFLENPDPDVTKARIDAFNAAIARQAALFNVPVANLAAQPFTDSEVNPVDGFHPSNAGHQAIANQFLIIIRPRFCVVNPTLTPAVASHATPESSS